MPWYTNIIYSTIFNYHSREENKRLATNSSSGPLSAGQDWIVQTYYRIANYNMTKMCGSQGPRVYMFDPCPQTLESILSLVKISYSTVARGPAKHLFFPKIGDLHWFAPKLQSQWPRCNLIETSRCFKNSQKPWKSYLCFPVEVSSQPSTRSGAPSVGFRLLRRGSEVTLETWLTSRPRVEYRAHDEHIL